MTSVDVDDEDFVSLDHQILEGGEDGEIDVGSSTVFALLEVCVCVLIRSMPSINPDFKFVVEDFEDFLIFVDF